jgi:hypothetical protein
VTYAPEHLVGPWSAAPAPAPLAAEASPGPLAVPVPLAHESPEASLRRLSADDGTAGFGEAPAAPPTGDLWVPGAERVQGPKSGGSYVDAPWRFVFHTIEGEPSADGFRRLVAGHTNPPHLWAMPSADLLLQTIPLNKSAYALARPGSNQTNRLHAVQVELWGFAAKMGQVPPEVLDWLACRVLAPVARLVPIDLTVARQPTLGERCYGRTSPCRMSAQDWLAFTGVCGHKDVPDNDHWDPGNLDLPGIAVRARAIVAPAPAQPAQPAQPTPAPAAPSWWALPDYVKRAFGGESLHDGPDFASEREDEDHGPGGYETGYPMGYEAETGYATTGLAPGGYENEAGEYGLNGFEGETPVEKARATIVAQTRRWGTDEDAIMTSLRALTPAQMAELAQDSTAIDALNSELSGPDKAAAGAELARGRVGSMGQADVSAVTAAPARYRVGTLAAAHGRDVLLQHQAAVDATGIGTVHGTHCPAPPPRGAQSSDCTVYVKQVLERAFAAGGQTPAWTKVWATALRTSAPDGIKGTELMKALQAELGWEALFWGADPRNPADGQPDHPVAYKAAKAGEYYGIRLLVANAVVGYRRTAAGAAADLGGIERLRRLPFGVLTTIGGVHMAMIINGSVYEVHWDKPATDRNAVEATPLESFGTRLVRLPRGDFNYATGAIAAPPGDIGLAWRTP